MREYVRKLSIEVSLTPAAYFGQGPCSCLDEVSCPLSHPSEK